jgi:hypothetical protein
MHKQKQHIYWNKTRALLQSTGGKDEPNIALMRISQNNSWWSSTRKYKINLYIIK